MAAPPKPKKEYTYGDVFISLENCILPDEKLSETPSIKDGLEKESETDLRILGCEFIQTSGLLLKLPQVAMATGQILLQRFYYSKSLVKHDVEICAMACIFLAAKIEESPRRLRDVVNVFHHIKQKRSKRPIVAMDYYSSVYFGLKNNVIKAERRILKELGFCVHVKHPHKIIITYLQILEHEKNIALVQKAWNYMNDSLRTDVFLKFAPEKIGCACVLLAARMLKIVLPQRPPWWELFDAELEDIEEISVTILKLYARPKARMSKLDEAIEKAKKLMQEKKDVTKENGLSESPGSFTPAHVSSSAAGLIPGSKLAENNNEQRSNPQKDTDESRRVNKNSKDGDARDRKRRAGRSRSPTPPRRKNVRAGSNSSYGSDSDSMSPDRKRKAKKDVRPRNSSSDSDGDSRRNRNRRNENRAKPIYQRENGHRTYSYDKRLPGRSGSRSRSRSPSRRNKKYDKKREKLKRKDEKPRGKPRDNERDYKNSHERYDKKAHR